MVIAAFAGTGKTTFASMYPQQVIDFVCMPYKYYLPEQETDCDESCKANPDNIMHEDWPHNYITAIKEALLGGKILLIPSDSFVLALLCAEGIPYTLCYPQREAKEVYRSRFIKRGNTEDFLSIFIDGWDCFMDTLERDTYGKHIVMQPHQYLCDVIKESVLYADKH